MESNTQTEAHHGGQRVLPWLVARSKRSIPSHPRPYPEHRTRLPSLSSFPVPWFLPGPNSGCYCYRSLIQYACFFFMFCTEQEYCGELAFWAENTQQEKIGKEHNTWRGTLVEKSLAIVKLENCMRLPDTLLVWHAASSRVLFV